MEDGWRVGGREDGAGGLLGNLIAADRLGQWMQLVDTFSCYPGPRLLYKFVPEGGESLIPLWEVPGWAVLANLGMLGTSSRVTEDRRLRLRDLCRTRPDRKQWSAVEESKQVGRGEIMTTLNRVRSGMFVEEPETEAGWQGGNIAGDVVGGGGGGMGWGSGMATRWFCRSGSDCSSDPGVRARRAHKECYIRTMRV